MQHIIPLILFSAFCIYSTQAQRISKNFENFLVSRYGVQVARSIYRPGIAGGSLGGGNHKAGTHTKKIPVIFIHGLGGKASDYSAIHKEFLNAGYTLNELYAITWGTPLALMTNVHFQCEFVVQIRRFIQSVADFTKRKVDVIGYSMGSPLLRKAILGGRCVNNANVNMGAPITSRIRKFLSVGGANYGSHLCSTTGTKMCNAVSGLRCNSAYIRDINSRTGYEGSKVLAIYHPNDEIIGSSSVCGIPPYTLRGAEYYKFSQSSHYAVLWESRKLQVKLITKI